MIISHPHGEYDLLHLAATNKPPRKITELAEADPSFTALIERMQHEESGSGLRLIPQRVSQQAFCLHTCHQPGGRLFAAVIDGTTKATSP